MALSTKLQWEFARFGRRIDQFDSRSKKGRELDELFHDLLDLATSRKNADGTIAPPLTEDEEDAIIEMMVV